MQSEKPCDPLFSIVCASNRADVLSRFLLPSVRSQDVPCEVCIVDTVVQRFDSCAAALNAGAREAKGRYLMFVHQDVAWDGSDFLRRAARLLDDLPHLGAAGVIGMSDKGRTQDKRGRHVVLLGERPGTLHGWTPIKTPEAVQTVDDLMIIVPAALFRRFPFDAGTCNGWHLYAVDYCLSAAQRGLAVYVLPLLVQHLSAGKVDGSYFRSLRNVLAKHRRRHVWIYTTCGAWTTRRPIEVQQLTRYARGITHRAFRCLVSRFKAPRLAAVNPSSA